jgi:hypothetical protein
LKCEKKSDEELGLPLKQKTCKAENTNVENFWFHSFKLDHLRLDKNVHFKDTSVEVKGQKTWKKRQPKTKIKFKTNPPIANGLCSRSYKSHWCDG